MVSVRRASLADRYIEGAKNIINILEEKGFHIAYAYWHIRYGESQEWYDGEWRILIASSDLKFDNVGIRIVLDIQKDMGLASNDYMFSIDVPDWDNDQREWDKILIKEPI